MIAMDRVPAVSVKESTKSSQEKVRAKKGKSSKSNDADEWPRSLVVEELKPVTAKVAGIRHGEKVNGVRNPETEPEAGPKPEVSLNAWYELHEVDESIKQTEAADEVEIGQ
ncbi:unnamed protein product [Agarophyton chilense]